MKIIAASAVGLVLAGVLSAAPAQAQNARSFVSGHGLDTNACTLTAPCRTFATAFTHTNAGGEIDVLDTAGYGPLTINKAISIVNDGSIASVLVASGGTGITITAGTSDAISLRGLTIEGAGVGNIGIQFNTGKSLTVTNCIIRHVTSDGIDFLPNLVSTLSVSNTVVSDNGNTAIAIVPTGTNAVTAVFNRVETNNNANTGILVDGLNNSGAGGGVLATVSDSIASGNLGAGFQALSDLTHADTRLMIARSVVAYNGTGLLANGARATVRLAQSTVTGNFSGWETQNIGVIVSAGDSTIEGNLSNETTLPTYVPK